VPTGTFVWATGEGLDHVNRLNTADGQLLSWDLPTSTSCGRENLAVDSSGNAWVGKSDQKIAMVDPGANTITEWPMPTTASYCPEVFASEGSGASQKVWFCEAAIDKIGFLAPATGSVTEWTISGNNFNDCYSRDASGRIWFSRNTTEILRLDPGTNELTTYPCPVGCTNVQGVSPEVSGKVWFAEGSQINSFAPATGQFADYSGTSCSPDSIFIDPAGNVWTTTQSTTICRFPAP
jgi:streptogramin lyase